MCGKPNNYEMYLTCVTFFILLVVGYLVVEHLLVINSDEISITDYDFTVESKDCCVGVDEHGRFRLDCTILGFCQNEGICMKDDQGERYCE